MSRLTMQEVIEHCETTAKDIEKTHERYRKWLELEPMPISVKRYYEHKQTAEWLKELQHYKDLEEQGRLIELPCERVYCIVDTSNPKFALIMSKRTSELRVYEIERIDKDGYYWSTKEEAEARLAELKGTEE